MPEGCAFFRDLSVQVFTAKQQNIPDLTGSRPMMHWSRVVLPTPLRPIRQVHFSLGNIADRGQVPKVYAISYRTD